MKKDTSHSLQKKTNSNLQTRQIAICGILAAASVILGKFMQIPIGDTIRISLENLPVLFAGIVFGSVPGMIVGIVADLVGCVARGYEINLIITAGAALVGFLSGMFGGMKTIDQKNSFLQIVLPTALAHVVGSMMVKSVGLYVFYSTPWRLLFATRVPIYIVNIVVESLIIYVLLKSKGVRHSLGGFLK